MVFHKKHRLTEIEINLLAEAFYLDQLQAYMTKNDNGIYHHTMIRSSDNKELCRAKLGVNRE